MREALELALRIERGDEEGLGLIGVSWRKEASAVVDNALRRQVDIEVSRGSALDRREVAGLGRCCGLQEVPE